MMCSLLRSLSLLIVATAGVLGQQLDTKLSFGHTYPLGKDSQSVSEWDIHGEPHNPVMHSDRILFTPGYGTAKTSMWAKNKNTHPEWVASLKFRASGPERSSGGGMFQIWYEKQGKANIGLNSIYTVDKFDGLAIVIDTYGGQAGSIRAFLNDGSTSYKSSKAVDSLSFGHCSFPYRNLGYPSEIKLTQTKDYFQVDVGNRVCFKSDKVKLPWDYYFGLNAQTSANPDSFEVFSFGISSDTHIAPHDEKSDTPSKPVSATGKFEEPEDRAAEFYKSQQEQFADLHNRIQALTHLVSTLYQEIVLLRSVNERVDEQIRVQARADQVARLEHKFDSLERTVQVIKNDVEGKDYKEHLVQLQQSLRDTHSSLLEHLPRTLHHMVLSSAPRMGFFIFLIIVSQVLLAGSYLIYKRRQKMRPKKYL